jgi:hypothetical protein
MNHHERARRTHLRAARVHDEAAIFWQQRGYRAAATRELVLASEQRSGALVEQGLSERAAGRVPILLRRRERERLEG